MIITQEQPVHAGAIEALLDTAFGRKRHTKTVYKLRAGVDPLEDLGFVALDDDALLGPRLVGTIRYWPVMVGGSGAGAGTQALLLGPIAIAADVRSQGLGAALIRHSLDRARALGHRTVLLVGDAPYYERFGFSRAATLGLSLPGPVDPDRFLGLALTEGALDGLTGTVRRMPVAAAAVTPLSALRHRPRRAVR